MQTLFAIRQKSTGFYLPEPDGHAGRGGSHTEPVPESRNNVRLFASQLSAKRALTSWLQGEHVPVTGYESDEYDGHVHAYQDGVAIIYQPHRVKEDMEVVSIQLTLVKQNAYSVQTIQATASAANPISDQKADIDRAFYASQKP